MTHVFVFIVLVFSVPPSLALLKGVGSISDRSPWLNCTDLVALKVSWYYNWLSTTSCDPPPASFVPMIWGPMFINDTETVSRSAPALLGFNEPDLEEWTPTEMAHLWPRLEATGLRLGSPAPSAWWPGGYQWLDEFFNVCKNCRVDFVAFHWYADSDGCNADALITDITFYANRYKKPVWVTEFDCPDKSYEENLEFMKAVLPRLENECPMLERFAWFTTRPFSDPQYQYCNLITKDGQTTILGDYYIQFQPK